MVYINNADISWHQTDADIAEAEQDDIYKFITREEVEDIERAYEAQVQQAIDYHIG